ncbi:hypothetical protein ACHQM5_028668 [Ranunculus cassubicifolius]
MLSRRILKAAFLLVAKVGERKQKGDIWGGFYSEFVKILCTAMVYLWVVLFPEATLPLRVIHPSCKAAIDKALDQLVAPYTIGVLRVHRHPDDGSLCFASVGTTAEIRQYKRLDDGSVNIVTRGQQRFHLRRTWIDVEGAPRAEVQIVEEDLPLRTPRDAFGQLASVSNSWRRNLSNSLPLKGSPARQHLYTDEESDSESISQKSFSSARSSPESRFRDSSTDSGNERDSIFDQLANSDEEIVCEPEGSSQPIICKKDTETDNIGLLDTRKEFIKCEESCKGEKRHGWVASASGHRAPTTFWPNWVFRMFDSYCLAQRAADMWKQTVGAPSMDDLVNKPDLLSFYIASKIPVSESTRQELLEINGISYRLRREIQLLESVDRVRCKTCETLIAKRSDMLVMSTDGPLGAYVNPHGYVHEIMTLYKVNGLALIGHPDKAYSWFPGYAWTIAVCATCEMQLGWLFTATNKKLKPRSFWGIRSSQVADII